MRLADVDVIIKDLTAMKRVYDAIELDGMIKALKEAPTIEAEPVKHGKVIERLEDGKFKRCCSCCDEDLTVATMWTVIQYCPYCGARMDGE